MQKSLGTLGCKALVARASLSKNCLLSRPLCTLQKLSGNTSQRQVLAQQKCSSSSSSATSDYSALVQPNKEAWKSSGVGEVSLHNFIAAYADSSSVKLEDLSKKSEFDLAMPDKRLRLRFLVSNEQAEELAKNMGVFEKLGAQAQMTECKGPEEVLTLELPPSELKECLMELMKQNPTELRLLMTNNQVGGLIGKGAASIKSLRQTHSVSGDQLKISEARCPQSTDRVVLMKMTVGTVARFVQDAIQIVHRDMVDVTSYLKAYDPKNFYQGHCDDYLGFWGGAAQVEKVLIPGPLVSILLDDRGEGIGTVRARSNAIIKLIAPRDALEKTMSITAVNKEQMEVVALLLKKCFEAWHGWSSYLVEMKEKEQRLNKA